MKYFSVLLCLFLCYKLSTQDPEEPDERILEELYEKCAERAGVTREDVEHIENSDEEMVKLMNNDGDFRKFGCYLACLYQEYGFMTGKKLIRTPYEESDVQEDDSRAERRLVFQQVRDACIETANEEDDECEVALSFKACMEATWPPSPLS